VEDHAALPDVLDEPSATAEATAAKAKHVKGLSEDLD